MKVYFLLLTLIALFQTSFLPVNLCLLVIIAKSFASYDKENYYLAFFTGIMLGILSPVNLGFWALVFLIVVYLTHLARKLPITANNLTILPVSFVIILTVTLLESIILKQKINIRIIFIDTMLMLPLFIFVKIWEERFVVKDELKLKLGNR